MKLLFEISNTNEKPNGNILIRPSARSIIIKDHKIAMVHSIKYNYYKFPGGGLEQNETMEEALIRETMEEAGLIIEKNTIQEYGYVHRVEKCRNTKYAFLVQDNYYYLCKVSDEKAMQKLDAYESEEQFTLEYINPIKAIEINMNCEHGPKSVLMIQREAKVLQLLIDDGYFM